MSISDTRAAAVLDYLFRGVAPAAPDAALHLALTVGGTEVTGGGYARMPISFSRDVPRTVYNTSAIAFPTPTGSWGGVNGWKIFNASTGGTLVDSGSFSSTRTIDATSAPVTIAAGTITINIP